MPVEFCVCQKDKKRSFFENYTEEEQYKDEMFYYVNESETVELSIFKNKIVQRSHTRFRSNEVGACGVYSPRLSSLTLCAGLCCCKVPRFGLTSALYTGNIQSTPICQGRPPDLGGPLKQTSESSRTARTLNPDCEGVTSR